MTTTAESLELVQTVEPDIRSLMDTHRERREHWYAHEVVPWEQGRNYRDEPWDESQASVSRPVRTALVLNLLTEDNLPYYHARIAGAFPADSAMAEWSGLWTAEEGQHSIAIRDFLLTSRNCDPRLLEEDRLATVSRGWSIGYTDPVDIFNYTSVQELATRVSHRNAGVKARTAELAAVIELMGRALKSIQGDDTEFHGGLEQSLQRLRQAASGVQVRHVGKRLEQLLDATTEQLAAQRQARERRIRGLSDMVQGLHEQLSQARVKLTEDALTGLYNRGSFDARLEAELKKCRLSPYRFALIMIDLDNFKSVNDEHGHVAGDRVLVACAQATQAIVLRRSDFCARYGGEEMAVLLTDCDMDGGRKVAEAIRERIASLEISTGQGVVHQTASFGVSEGCDEAVAVDVIERADAALYAAKRAGRNRVVVAGRGEARRVRLPRCQVR